MKENYVSVSVADGTILDAYTSLPKEGAGPFPGLLLFQEAFGINHHIRSIADRLATQGYLVIAPELFHRSGPGFEGDYLDFPAVMPNVQALTPAGQEADIKAAFDWLQNQPSVIKNKIGAIGFCMGGRVSILANSILPLSASVSYYAGNTASILNWVPAIHGPQLMFWGGLDKHIPPEQIATLVKTLRDNGKPYINVEIAYADHGFNCDERASYQPKAAREAWSMTIAFLENNLK
jgi:carboxymethylenebutenolidase